MSTDRVIAQRDVIVLGSTGHTVPASAEAVLTSTGERRYRIPALGLNLDEDAATHYAGGLPDLVAQARAIRPHTVTID